MEKRTFDLRSRTDMEASHCFFNNAVPNTFQLILLPSPYVHEDFWNSHVQGFFFRSYRVENRLDQIFQLLLARDHNVIDNALVIGLISKTSIPSKIIANMTQLQIRGLWFI